jgi:hypothetical protein
LIQTKKKSTTGLLLVVLSAAILSLGAAILVSLSAIQNNTSMAYPQQQQRLGYYSHSQGGLKPEEYAAGTISSLQNNQNGNPAWIVSGYWKGGLIMNKSSTSSTNTNTTSTSKPPLPTGIFRAMFNMVMLNGSAMHKHQISNFTLTSISMPTNMTAVYNGTATITMKEGPVHNVPISIRTMNDNTISIWVDQTKTNNHFGNTPIFGTILKHVIVKK